MRIEKGPKEKDSHKLSRRSFLKILSSVGSFGLILSLKGDTRKEEKETRKEFSLEEILSNINKELSSLSYQSIFFR
jgi:hypothetical protein